MAGLLAWAADVVGGGHGAEDDDEVQFPALVFTPEQEKRARELDQRAASLRRSTQELRRRITPADISQRLPHLHAHSLASNAALALQLNAHSTTRQQAQLREETLQEENTTYEKALFACQKKIQEKAQEASLLQSKLEEMDFTERELKAELDKAQATWEDNQPRVSLGDSKHTEKISPSEKPFKNVLLEKLNEKKSELRTFEGMVHSLEEKWAAAQHDSPSQPSPGGFRRLPLLSLVECAFAVVAASRTCVGFLRLLCQREKTLEKQLHSLIEQLTIKQAQAEGLISEIKIKEQELEKLNMLRTRLESGSMEENTARNRFGRSRTETAYVDHPIGTQHRHLNGINAESQQKLNLLRSAFVLHILALHVLVFIKISF